MFSIMIVSGIGGAGKSKIGLCIASALSASGKKTLFAETVPGFRGADIAFGMDSSVVYDISDVLAARCPLERAVLSHTKTGVSFIPSPFSARWLPESDELSSFVKDVSDSGYEFLIFDTPAGFGSLHSRLGEFCDMALIVTPPELSAVRSASNISDELAAFPSLVQKLIINKVPEKLPFDCGIDDLDSLIDIIGVPLLGVFPLQHSKIDPCEFPAISVFNKAAANVALRLCGKQKGLLPQFLK